MRRFGTTGVAIGLAVAACATEVPARLVAVTPESRAELQHAVTEALGGTRVTLADDALTLSSTLTLEHAPPDDAMGRAATGRDMGRPQRFQLLKIGRRCVLVHESDGARAVLTQASCVPEQT
jgi:hypothetical protein